MKVVDLNIALILPLQAQLAAIQLSQEIASLYNSEIVLSDKENFPHVTLYMISIYKKDLTKLLAFVKKIAMKTEKVELEFNGYGGRDGYVDVSFGKTQEITKLHKKVVERLSPVRNGIVRKKYQKGSRLYEEADAISQKYIDKYGVPDILAKYRPHLTLAKLEHEDIADRVTGHIKWGILKLRGEKIGVFYKGPRGTCKELIQLYQLNT